MAIQWQIRTIVSSGYNKILAGLGLFLLSISSASSQQTSSIQGTIKDMLGKTPLYLATISVIKIKDSTILGQTITNQHGFFRVVALPGRDSLLLSIRYLGYDVYQKAFVLRKEVLDLGDIPLNVSVKQLDTILIIGQREAVTVRQDTIEFNASSFITPPNAVIEALLKKLPGLEIDANGNMTFNGKKISKVLVNGREFFSNDTRIATQNLPVDIVDKIQVMDTRTLQQQYGGIGVGGISDDKTLNIKLRKEKKIFGSATTGAGSDKRYEAAAMFNHFSGTQIISLLVGANNINKIGFSLNPGADQSIQSVSFVNEGNGITASKLGGIHFSDEKGKVKYNVNYQYNNAFTDRSLIKERRQYVVPDSFFFTANNSKTDDRSLSHRLYLSIEVAIDSTSALLINPIFSYGKTLANNFNHLQTTTEKGEAVNSSESHLVSEGISTNVIGYIFWGKRFKKEGRYLSFLFNPYYDKRETEETNQVKSLFYKNNNSDSLALLNQNIREKSNTHRSDILVSYTEPVSKMLRLNMTEGIRRNQSYTDRKLFNRDSAGNNSNVDSAYTTIYTTTTMNATTTLSLAYIQPKWEASAGATTTYSQISNEIHIKNISLSQRQFNYAPSINFNYKIAKNKNVRLAFFANTTQPSLEQLRPVPDNSNPLLIRMGNPDLKPSFTSNYLINYLFSNSKANIFLTGDMQYVSEQNTIVNAITYDNFGRQVSQYVNVDGNYSSSIYLYFRKGWRTTYEQKGIAITLNASQRRSSTFVNGLQTKIQTFRWSPSLSLQYNYKTIVDFNASYTPAFNRVRYNQSSIASQNYLLHALQASLRISWPKDFSLESNMMYNYSSQAPTGFKKDALLLNVNIMQQVFKNKQGLLKLSVYDLLKQNNNIRRTTADNYIEDVASNILQQYFMLSFAYKLNFNKLKNNMGK